MRRCRSERDVVTFPSTLGGGGFGGVSYNPQLGLVFVNVSQPRHGGPHGAADRSEDRRSDLRRRTRRRRRVRPVLESREPNSVFGAAVRRARRRQRQYRRHRLARPARRWSKSWRRKGIRNTGALNLGGSMATASGLVFIGATADNRFRAFDAKTGKELWVAKLDADAKAAPMTFLGRDGRQYVVIMAGGGHQLSRTTPASGSNLHAFALPSKPKE